MSGVWIRIIDRKARKEFQVEPLQFTGRLLLRQLTSPRVFRDEAYVELYLAESNASNQIGLYRSGTRILEDLTQISGFQRATWIDGWIQGILIHPSSI